MLVDNGNIEVLMHIIQTVQLPSWCKPLFYPHFRNGLILQTVVDFSKRKITMDATFRTCFDYEI